MEIRVPITIETSGSLAAVSPQASLLSEEDELMMDNLIVVYYLLRACSFVRELPDD